ncbi:autophagy-related protein 16-1 [Scleropages formosus]|uniref:autophagy-related protein 16-1 n=1 Tax=Scleropages formosus TaxID=113540 RepID=UPI0010FABE32|nr:autophagy-related protein 16-1-like [Scleropages formosus]
MERWKSHVRAAFFHRDFLQKDPFSGVFSAYSRLVEKCDLRERVWDESQKLSPAGDDRQGQSLCVPFDLYLSLRDSEQAKEELLQTITDLRGSLCLKDAELQYCHSQVSRYRQEAVSLARNSAVLEDTLSECQFTVEQLVKELEALRSQQRILLEELEEVRHEKEELQERWLQEKRHEAERVNQSNEAQERWQRFTRRLARHLRKGEQSQREAKGGQCTFCRTTTAPPGGEGN